MKMKRLLKYIICTALLGACGHPAYGQSGASEVDEYYTSVISGLTVRVRDHLTQLDKCLEELEKRDSGQFLTPVDCPKVANTMPEFREILSDSRIALESWNKWAGSLSHASVAENSKQSIDQLNSALNLFEIKYRLAEAKAERVNKKDLEFQQEVEGSLKDMADMLKKMEAEE